MKACKISIGLGLLMAIVYDQFELDAQAMTLSPYHKSPIASPFEKIYINPLNLVGMPDGLYYFDEDGSRIKVGAVLNDCQGTYVLKIEYQCPLCGRTYLNKIPNDEHSCPIFQEKILHPEINLK